VGDSASGPKTVGSAHNGFSFFVFCEAAKPHLACLLHALDGWEGDDKLRVLRPGGVFRVGLRLPRRNTPFHAHLLKGYFNDSVSPVSRGQDNRPSPH
jgi:hypothetical protein